MDWYWPRNSIQSWVPSGKKIEYSSSSRSITSRRRRWGDWILEIKRLSSERFFGFLSIGLMNDEMWKSKMQGGGRQQANISILCWFVRTRNSLPPSSSRSIRTQSHWSFIAGQCVNSGQFLLDVPSIYTPSQILIARVQNSSRDRQTVFFTAVNPMDKDHIDPHKLDLTKPRLESYKQTKWKRPRYGVFGRYTACST